MDARKIKDLVHAYLECNKKEKQLKELFCGENDCDFLQSIKSDIFNVLACGLSDETQDKIFEALYDDNADINIAVRITYIIDEEEK